MASPWTNDPYAQARLTKEQVELYLERIALPKDLVHSPPSLDLLKTLMVSHLEHVAKDTSPLHVPEEQWDGPSTPIKLSSAFTNMPESTGAFDRVVQQRKGAFCFAINATFAALLRSFGFRVSELVGRAFKSLGNDPTVHEDGWRWGTLTHELLVADWQGSDGRWLVDGAWGPWSCSVPIKLENGAQTLGLNPYEAFEVRHEVLPLDAAAAQPIDSLAGWTLYRFIPPPDTPLSLPLTGSTTGHFSPQFHFHPLSIPTTDFQLYHHFSVSHELASFTAFFLVTKLIPGTGGARRSLMYADKPGEGRRAKVYTTGGTEGRGSLQGRDVEWVEMETGPMKEYLRQEFGFGFT
ncbi:uncharacterized protein JCM10292_001252 [Rhodotorula paludigena]|uniref:uncharacterized protein n=1 Tax=Rhodotorula paludigena TaxID=86838 RepID=UPI003177F800